MYSAKSTCHDCKLHFYKITYSLQSLNFPIIISRTAHENLTALIWTVLTLRTLLELTAYRMCPSFCRVCLVDGCGVVSWENWVKCQCMRSLHAIFRPFAINNHDRTKSINATSYVIPMGICGTQLGSSFHALSWIIWWPSNKPGIPKFDLSHLINALLPFGRWSYSNETDTKYHPGKSFYLSDTSSLTLKKYLNRCYL